MAEEEKSESGFIIIDRRGSKEEEAAGEPEAVAEPEAAAEPEEAAEPQAQASETRDKARKPAEGPGAQGGLPSVDFSTFALSLGTSALYHMGLVGDPESGERVAEPNLALARQTIDTLAMLETKTQGNLEQEEARLLEGLLYELRMRFVEAGK
jgi:hypothetical protein